MIEGFARCPLALAGSFETLEFSRESTRRIKFIICQLSRSLPTTNAGSRAISYQRTDVLFANGLQRNGAHLVISQRPVDFGTLSGVGNAAPSAT
jgi:hypothetical protein